MDSESIRNSPSAKQGRNERLTGKEIQTQLNARKQILSYPAFDDENTTRASALARQEADRVRKELEKARREKAMLEEHLQRQQQEEIRESRNLVASALHAQAQQKQTVNVSTVSGSKTEPVTSSAASLQRNSQSTKTDSSLLTKVGLLAAGSLLTLGRGTIASVIGWVVKKQ